MHPPCVFFLFKIDLIPPLNRLASPPMASPGRLAQKVLQLVILDGRIVIVRLLCWCVPKDQLRLALLFLTALRLCLIARSSPATSPPPPLPVALLSYSPPSLPSPPRSSLSPKPARSGTRWRFPIHSSTQQPLDDLLHLSPEAAPVQEDKPHKALIATQQEPEALRLCPATVLAWLLKMLHFKQQD
jgi:hypothetical protein